jgi:hypothetical protein
VPVVVAVTDDDNPVVPVQIVAQPITHGESESKGDIRWSAIIHALGINEGRIVVRHVDDVRLGRNDFDGVPVEHELLLRRGGERPVRLGHGPEALD